MNHFSNIVYFSLFSGHIRITDFGLSKEGVEGDKDVRCFLFWTHSVNLIMNLFMDSISHHFKSFLCFWMSLPIK